MHKSSYGLAYCLKARCQDKIILFSQARRLYFVQASHCLDSDGSTAISLVIAAPIVEQDQFVRDAGNLARMPRYGTDL